MTATPSLPPGTMGLPLLGETLAFGRNPFRFLEDRQKRHGNVFKSSLFGRKIVFLAGTEGAEAFYDAQNISREHRRHPMAFIPQGAEPPTGHRSLGLDYATFLSMAFVALLVRGYDWELPPQDLEYNWQKLPPEPRDGLRVRLRAKGQPGVADR